MIEYKVYYLSGSEEIMNEQLNELAKQGWNVLCSFHSVYVILVREIK